MVAQHSRCHAWPGLACVLPIVWHSEAKAQIVHVWTGWTTGQRSTGCRAAVQTNGIINVCMTGPLAQSHRDYLVYELTVLTPGPVPDCLMGWH